MKNKIFIEYDNSKLKDLNDKIKTLFINNNYDTSDINSFTISNKINDNSNTIEIIYPLKSNDTLAKTLSDKISSIIPVTKYYQQRDINNTNLDYYPVLRNNKAIVIRYGENILNNNELPKIIYQVINSYLNNSNVYIVKSGDSLYAIARRFNTTVDDIKRINNLSSNNLSINQKLIIPDSNISDINNDNNDYYIVKSGDTLFSIARKYNTTVDELKKLNNLSSNNLSISQKLIIPSNTIIYTVIKGDTLYAIAKKFNTTVDDIKRLNNLTSNNLSINQKLIIKK